MKSANQMMMRISSGSKKVKENKILLGDLEKFRLIRIFMKTENFNKNSK